MVQVELTLAASVAPAVPVEQAAPTSVLLVVTNSSTGTSQSGTGGHIVACSPNCNPWDQQIASGPNWTTLGTAHQSASAIPW